MKTAKEIKKAASEYSGFNIWSTTNSAYEAYLGFTHGANFANEAAQFQQEWVDVDKLKKQFDAKSDCYADRDNGLPIPAMTFESVVNLFKHFNLLPSPPKEK